MEGSMSRNPRRRAIKSGRRFWSVNVQWSSKVVAINLSFLSHREAIAQFYY
jgi:hypothetical protein